MEPLNGMMNVSTLHLATNCQPKYYYSLKKRPVIQNATD